MYSRAIALSIALLYPLVKAAIVSNGTSSVSSLTVAMTTLEITVEDLWNLYIGPIETYSVNTTIIPTPIPSTDLIPPPPIYYPSYLQGPETAAATRNQSWSLPKGFWWGVSSAAYQVEGAVKAEGRGPGLWDAFTHRAMSVADNQTGDVAINEYYSYKREIQRIAAMGVQVYSFSISWSRIFPFGTGKINEAGLAHYDDVINTCIEYGIKPYVTLYHWDLPLYLQLKYGGWVDEQIVEDFLDYAKVLFERWGTKVPAWFTFNEPLSFCGEYPVPNDYFPVKTTIPAVQQRYWCGRHMLLANGKAYQLARSLNITAPINIKFNGGWKLPLTNSSEDLEAVQRGWAFQESWFADVLWSTGDYPPLKSFVSSFLPNFTAEESALIKGSSDIFCHDAYTSKYYMVPDVGIEACLANSSNPLYPLCYNSTATLPASEGGWLIGPAADPNSSWLHKATKWVPALLRTAYYHDFVQAILLAVADGVDVVGALAWSIADNLEWTAGFTVKFGLQYVNLTTQERYYKASFFVLRDLFEEYKAQ